MACTGAWIDGDKAPQKFEQHEGLLVPGPRHGSQVDEFRRPVDPGAHVVRAEAAGFKPVEQSFQVAEAGSAEASLKLEKGSPDAVAGGTLMALRELP